MCIKTKSINSPSCKSLSLMINFGKRSLKLLLKDVKCKWGATETSCSSLPQRDSKPAAAPLIQVQHPPSVLHWFHPTDPGPTVPHGQTWRLFGRASSWLSLSSHEHRVQVCLGSLPPHGGLPAHLSEERQVERAPRVLLAGWEQPQVTLWRERGANVNKWVIWSIK